MASVTTPPAVLLLGAVGVASILFLVNKTNSKKKARAGRKSSNGGKKFIIGGNWKCETDCAKVEAIVDRLNGMGPIPDSIEVFVSPPSPHLSAVTLSLRSDIAVSSQDVGNLTKFGAFTGEAFAGMLKDVGCEWALAGHSERRQYQLESSALVAAKAAAAIAQGLGACVCIGESKEERQGGEAVLKKVLLDDQMTALLNVLGKDAEKWAQVVIAYEPVWAIGTGLSATPAIAQETHKIIRDWVSAQVGPAIAKALRIQYGGSVKGNTAEVLAACPDIDGFLVGGSSLTDDFLKIVANADKGLKQRK